MVRRIKDDMHLLKLRMFDPFCDIGLAFNTMVHRFMNDMYSLRRLMLLDPLLDIGLAFNMMVHRFMNDMYSLRRLMLLDPLLDIGCALNEMFCHSMDDMHHLRRLMLDSLFDIGSSFDMMFRCSRYGMLMRLMLDHLLDIGFILDKMFCRSMDDMHHLRKLILDCLDPPIDGESWIYKVNIWSHGRGQSQFFQVLSQIWTWTQRRNFTGRGNKTLIGPQSSLPHPAKVIKPRTRKHFEGRGGPLCSDIERENESLRRRLNCKECKEKRRGVVFIPCGHMILCWDCAAHVKNKCPTCKKDIKDRIRAQFS